jgi:hypothetical protein
VFYQILKHDLEHGPHVFHRFDLKMFIYVEKIIMLLSISLDLSKTNSQGVLKISKIFFQSRETKKSNIVKT